ncbi:MAG: hypothetical protein R3C05_14295 [Pirellulaceae bacterium]
MNIRVSQMIKSLCVVALLASTSLNAQEASETVTAQKPALPIAKATPVDDVKGVRPLSVTVTLIDGKTQIKGALVDTTSIDIKTSFGQATLPLSEVAGIRMADNSTPTTTAVMHSGDSITGASDIQRLTVETEWGMANINGGNVSSILFVPGLKWTSQSGLNGARWALVAEDAPATPTSNTSASNSAQPRAASATSGSSQIRSSQPVYSGQPTYGQPIIVRSR